MNNVFDILGIAPTAELRLVSTAYKKKALELHPDRAGGDTAKFQSLTEAYELVNEQAKLDMYYQHRLFAAEKQALRDSVTVHSAELNRTATTNIALAMPNRPIVRESTSMPGLIVMTIYAKTAQENTPRVHQIDLTDFFHNNRHDFVSAESSRQCFEKNYGKAINQGEVLKLVKQMLVKKGIVLSNTCSDSDCDKMAYALPLRPILKLSDSAPGEIVLARFDKGLVKRSNITAWVGSNYLSLLVAGDLKQTMAKKFGKVICLDEFNQGLTELSQATELLNASDMVQPSTLSRRQSETLALAFPDRPILRQSTSQHGMIAATICYKNQMQHLILNELLLNNSSCFNSAESALNRIEEGIFLLCKSKWEVFSEAESEAKTSEHGASRLEAVTPQEIINFRRRSPSIVDDSYTTIQRPRMT